MKFCVKEMKARCRSSRAHHAVVSNAENFQPTDGTRASAPACNRAAISGVPPARWSAGLGAGWSDRDGLHQVFRTAVLLAASFHLSCW